MQSTSLADQILPNAGISIRRFSVQEYHRLAEVGILGEHDRVELLEGFISPKMVHSPIHDATVSIVDFLLRGILLSEYFLRIQSAITLQTSEPEPDLTIVRGDPTRYLSSHPTGSDIAHVIEIAESSIPRDRLKAATYAAAGIPVYWIVNLNQQCVDVFENPVAGVYLDERRLSQDEELKLASCYQSDASVRASQLLPPRQ